MKDIKTKYLILLFVMIVLSGHAHINSTSQPPEIAQLSPLGEATIGRIINSIYSIKHEDTKEYADSVTTTEVLEEDTSYLSESLYLTRLRLRH